MTMSAWGVGHGEISKAMPGPMSNLSQSGKEFGMKRLFARTSSIPNPFRTKRSVMRTISTPGPFELNLGGVPDGIRSAVAQSAKARG